MSYSPMQLAEAFLRAGELDDALQALDTQVSLTPDAPEARRLRAQVLARGDASAWRLALADLAHLPHAEPDDYFLRISLLERLQEAAAARAAAAEAAAAFPDDARLLERSLELLRTQGLFAEAQQRLAALPSEQRSQWRWQQWAGDLAALAGDDAAALAAYSDALNTLQARYGLTTDAPARVLHEASDAAALTITGAFARLLLARGHLLRRTRRLDAADDDYAAAARLLPQDTTIAFYRGLVIVLRGEAGILHEAVTLCQTALSAASPRLREHLLAALAEDPAYSELAQRLYS